MIFQFNLPTKIIFGPGALSHLKEEIPLLGDNCLLVTGRSSIKKTGILRRIEIMLREKKVSYTVWSEVHGEPNVEVVNRGLQFAKEKKINLIISLGGGSVLDVAKAIAGLFNESRQGGIISAGEYLEGEGTRKIRVPGLPFIAIPTTAGTGSEVTRNSVLVNPQTRSKRSIRSDYMFARMAIVDPELTLFLPPSITATSGIDALTHLIEGYISKKATPFTDCIALSGIKLAGEALIRAFENGNDLVSREKLSLAALFGGIVLANSGLGVVHGVASFLGGLHQVSHGLACGILLPYALQYNLPVREEKLMKVARALGGTVGNDVVTIIKEMNKRIGIPCKLSEVGIKEKHLPEIARRSLTASSTRGNPREVSGNDLLGLLKKAL